MKNIVTTDKRRHDKLSKTMFLFTVWEATLSETSLLNREKPSARREYWKSESELLEQQLLGEDDAAGRICLKLTKEANSANRKQNQNLLIIKFFRAEKQLTMSFKEIACPKFLGMRGTLRPSWHTEGASAFDLLHEKQFDGRESSLN